MSPPAAALARGRLVLTAEHASAAVPPGVWLGLPAAALSGHRAWDPGPAALARQLAAATGAPLFLGRLSRLVVDLNRRATDPAAVPRVSFGLPVPGNQALGAADRAARLARWHRPWRQAVAQAVADRAAPGAPCLHLAVHSFSPALDPVGRDFDLGLLFDPDRPLEGAWVDQLGAALAAAGLRVRHNAPYLGTDEGLPTWLRARHPDPTYAGIELEVSQGLAPAGWARVAATLGTALGGPSHRAG